MCPRRFLRLDEEETKITTQPLIGAACFEEPWPEILEITAHRVSTVEWTLRTSAAKAAGRALSAAENRSLAAAYWRIQGIELRPVPAMTATKPAPTQQQRLPL